TRFAHACEPPRPVANLPGPGPVRPGAPAHRPAPKRDCWLRPALPPPRLHRWKPASADALALLQQYFLPTVRFPNWLSHYQKRSAPLPHRVWQPAPRLPALWPGLSWHARLPVRFVHGHGPNEPSLKRDALLPRDA